MRKEDKSIPEELQQRRSRRKKKRDRQVLIYKIIIAAAVVFLIVGVCVVVMGQGKSGESNMEESQTEAVTEESEENEEKLTVATPSLAEEIEPETDVQSEEFEEESAIADDPITEVLGGYENPGISNVSDYLNIREAAEETASLIGRLPANGVCEVLEVGDVWCRIRSGEIEGYVNGNYLLTGEDALEQVKQILETQDTLGTAIPFQ